MSAVVLRCFSFWRCFYNTLFACFHLLVFQPKTSCRPFPRSAAASVVILRSRPPRQFPAFLAVRVSRKRVARSYEVPAQLRTLPKQHVSPLSAEASSARVSPVGSARFARIVGLLSLPSVSSCRERHFRLPTQCLHILPVNANGWPTTRTAAHFPGFHSAFPVQPRTADRILLRFFQAMSGWSSRRNTCRRTHFRRSLQPT
jgi:hypothetical protein